MKRLRKIAITATCLSAFSLFVAFNTGLALPPYGRYGRPPCFAVFIVPFTNGDLQFQVPKWMYGGAPLLIFLISALTAIGYWLAFLMNWRLVRAQTVCSMKPLELVPD